MVSEGSCGHQCGSGGDLVRLREDVDILRATSKQNHAGPAMITSEKRHISRIDVLSPVSEEPSNPRTTAIVRKKTNPRKMMSTPRNCALLLRNKNSHVASIPKAPLTASISKKVELGIQGPPGENKAADVSPTIA